jgi:hypothetical protein
MLIVNEKYFFSEDCFRIYGLKVPLNNDIFIDFDDEIEQKNTFS